MIRGAVDFLWVRGTFRGSAFCIIRVGVTAKVLRKKLLLAMWEGPGTVFQLRILVQTSRSAKVPTLPKRWPTSLAWIQGRSPTLRSIEE